MNRAFLRQLRTLVILGRVSNLPTVWSNCLAGWWLGGGGNFANLPFLFFGVSALYLGGMYLNDAFDLDFDRQHRPERPIPSGAISLPVVWGWGLAWLGLGALSLIVIGKTTGALALVLIVCIIVYDATHKVITASPWLMGACRFWIYVIAGSTASWGVNGWPIWCGVALALYIAGLSHMARLESSRARIPRWPLVLLVVPVFLALLMDTGENRVPALLLSLILVLWIARCVRPMFQGGQVNVGRIVSGLLAGIVFVDWLAVAPGCPPALNAVFLILFGATLGLQRFVPAT
ncbi:MAG TPA: UbiA family prenyltransferase [Verrucomicrobiae bacterium]|nr:UbiA family prenyltransferase [Verrucomicrobiae bacterium]